ncbi:MAG: acyl-CoA thioesterase [Kiritimatiellae bacterium]|nr:acyl-CoA thioesterase [Kiritimatiellia bacterium]MDW8459258.1 thioesterase family protein [Verrucomicrobiota bacterium]
MSHPQPMFVHKTSVRLHDTDAAGVLYFANQFRIAHEAYEAFMEQAGFGLGDVLKRGKIALPIVRADGDFRMPLHVGDPLELTLRLLRMGRTSFTLVCRLAKDGKTAGHVTTTHVAIDPRTRRKKELPAALRRALAPLKNTPLTA